MAYGDYGAFVWLNGKRRKDKEDVATFATDEEIFGKSSETIPISARMWVSLINQRGKNVDWVNSIHHGILGDGNIRVMCHKQGLPGIYEATETGFKQIKYCDDDIEPYEYGEIKFEYKNHKFCFVSTKPYYAKMITPEGDIWECEYDYGYGSGFND